jgi:two-component system cell cycle sensor histidine kinase/response regulator CckA
VKKESRPPLFIVFLYALCGAFWIYFSDRLLPLFITTASGIAAWSTHKGWLYVAVTSLLLYWLIRRHTEKLLAAQEKERNDHEQMKLAQTALAQSEEQFRQMFAKHSAMLYLVDSETLAIFDANEAAQKFYGYSRDEFAKLTVADLESLPDADVRNVIETTAGKDTCYGTFSHRLANGDLRDVEIYSTPILLKNRQFYFYIVHDITERKQTEAALKASEANYHAIFDAVNDGIFIHDLETGEILDINWKSCEMFGYSRDEFPRLTPGKTTAPNSRFSMEEATRRMKEAAKGPPQLFEWKAKHRDGSIFWLEVNLKKVTISGTERLLAVVRDISSRKATDDALRESEARFRSLVEATTDWIWETDVRDVLTYSSQTVKSLLGYETNEVLGTNPFGLVTVEDLDRVTNLFEQAKKGKRPFFGVENRYRHKDGRIVILELSAVPIFDQHGDVTGYRGYERNITDRKNLEEQLLQAQKMEAIGQLAGGIAHDFNNILTAITGFVFILQMKLEDEELKRYIEQIRMAAERAAELTDSLLAFSRKQIICLKPLHINEVILATEKLLSRLIREDVEIRTDLSKENMVVLGEETKIEQIIINLATNARDAMPGGGILSIRTEHCLMEGGMESSILPGKPAGYVHLSISDTGLGIDKNAQDRIFEPFFTTKEVGKGTGLGLSIVYGLVKQLNGYIHIQSESKIGTSVSIYFPLVQEDPEKSAYVQRTAPKGGGGETLLVAEDDPDVRSFIRTVLEEFGYTVIEAVDGMDAVSKFRENRDRIKVAIFDIIMPKKNGRDAYLEIRKMHPELKAIFVSGYTGEFLTEEGILQEGLHFLPKPVVPWSLLEKVQEVLGTS